MYVVNARRFNRGVLDLGAVGGVINKNCTWVRNKFADGHQSIYCAPLGIIIISNRVQHDQRRTPSIIEHQQLTNTNND
jgi:hypothetical protein